MYLFFFAFLFFFSASSPLYFFFLGNLYSVSFKDHGGDQGEEDVKEDVAAMLDDRGVEVAKSHRGWDGTAVRCDSHRKAMGSRHASRT